MASKNVKKVSINNFENVMKENYVPTVSVDWHGVQVTVKRSLKLDEVIQFVRKTVQSCFATDTGEYLPEVEEFAIRSNVLEMYANFNMPANVGHQYDLVMNTDAYDCVVSFINQEQLSCIIKSIEKKIAYIIDTKSSEIALKLSDLTTQYEDAVNKINDLFSGVTREDVSNIAKAMSSGDFSYDAIAKAYMNNAPSMNSVPNNNDYSETVTSVEDRV